MNRFPSRTVVVVAVIAVSIVGSAFAQAPTPPGSPAAPPAPPVAAPVAASVPAPTIPPNPAVEQRITALHAQLGITEAQTPLWTAFAQAMRDNAASTAQLFQQRASAAATMSAADNMHSYAGLARTYADNTASLATAFDSLYASLSPTQKQAADTLFRQQSTMPRRR